MTFLGGDWHAARLYLTVFTGARTSPVSPRRAGTSWDELEAIDCAQPHDAEYAGSFKVPGTTAPTGDKRDNTFDECWNVVARYLGGTVDGMRMGYIPWGMDPRDWQRGDRWVRCFAWSSEKKTRGSVKGLGDRTPPS